MNLKKTQRLYFIINSINIMAKKEFSKFFVASLKRTAQNVSALVREKQKLIEKMKEADDKLHIIQKQIDSYDAPIREATGGYGVEDLIFRTVEITDKTDKDGKPVKVTKWNLKYPETIIPVEESEIINSEKEEEEETIQHIGNPIEASMHDPAEF